MSGRETERDKGGHNTTAVPGEQCIPEHSSPMENTAILHQYLLIIFLYYLQHTCNYQ